MNPCSNGKKKTFLYVYDENHSYIGMIPTEPNKEPSFYLALARSKYGEDWEYYKLK